MKTVFTLSAPAAVYRCGKMKLWEEFSVSLDDALALVDSIGPAGAEYLRVSGARYGTAPYYLEGWGFPLQVTLRLTDWADKRTFASISARLYRNQAGLTLGWVEWKGAVVHHGFTKLVFKEIASEILEHLRSQAERRNRTAA